MKFALFIGEINGKIIFSFLYFVLIGAYALISKTLSFVRKHLKKAPPSKSFWVEKKYVEPTIENMKRQF